jgi:ribosomal protein S18 acetylase RimI-like enzyme
MITIRAFNILNDYDRALTLWKNSGEGIGLGASDQPQEIFKKLQRDPDLFLVACDDDHLVGTVIGGFDGRRGMVYHLAVDENYRHQGLGSLLMAEIERRLRTKGCIKAYLMVKNGNSNAYNFYEKNGWNEMKLVQLFGKNL